MIDSRNERDRLLSVWAQDRLDDPETATWAAGAVKQIRDNLGANTAALFEFLNEKAQKQDTLSEPIKKLWAMINIAAQERQKFVRPTFIYEFSGRAKANQITTDDVDMLAEGFRPRLEVSELSSWVRERRDVEANPINWVSWDFSNSFRSSQQYALSQAKSALESLPQDLVVRFIQKCTFALQDALAVARGVRWIHDSVDLPNSLVHRVRYEPPAQDGQLNDNKHAERDPDAHNDNFAPIVRIMSASVDQLSAQINPPLSETVLQWNNSSEALFSRLYACALEHRQLFEPENAASYLVGLADYPFWRWIVFPEIATLRVKRWNEFPADLSAVLSERLLAGPPSQIFSVDTPEVGGVVEFHRDHELARLVDANADVPGRFREIVRARRETDNNFPKQVAAVEVGLPGVEVRWVPDGNPGRFADLVGHDLISALVTVRGENSFWTGNDAEAFGRTYDGKRRILEALPNDLRVERSQLVQIWTLLLSPPTTKIEENVGYRELVELTAQLALRLDDTIVSELIARLSFWLDYVDEKLPRFKGADELWHKLVPYSIEHANRETESPDADLTMAALNEPIGHLFSVFIRRCPTIREPQDFNVGEEFTGPLKQSAGRAREIVANRLVIHMNYFALADAKWLDESVLLPMQSRTSESWRLWEAFAKYGSVPRSAIWNRLQFQVFNRLPSETLSPEAKRQLAEMATIVWSWSREPNVHFDFEPTKFRSALTSANDDVRSAAAWRFGNLFRSEDNQEKLSDEHTWPRNGRAFFDEIWPLEPALQSSKTAMQFSRIPALVGTEYFSDAVDTIIPFIVPFVVWATMTEFGLDIEVEHARQLVTRHPEDVLSLMAASISDDQSHRVHQMKATLDLVAKARPELKSDPRYRFLSRFAD